MLNQQIVQFDRVAGHLAKGPQVDDVWLHVRALGFCEPRQNNGFAGGNGFEQRRGIETANDGCLRNQRQYVTAVNNPKIGGGRRLVIHSEQASAFGQIALPAFGLYDDLDARVLARNVENGPARLGVKSAERNGPNAFSCVVIGILKLNSAGSLALSDNAWHAGQRRKQEEQNPPR